MHIGDLVEIGFSLGLEIWLVVLLFRRDTQRHFPRFFLYVVVAAIATVSRLSVHFRYSAYFYVYWWTEAILLPLSLIALHEVFHWMFEGFYRLWWFRVFYYGTISTVLALVIAHALASPPVQAHPVISLILDFGIGVNFVRGGIVALFIVLTKLLMVEFRRYAYGIMVGFGIASAGALLSFIPRSEFGTRFENLAVHLPPVAYIVGATIWVAVFIRPEPDEREWEPPMSPEQMLAEVQSYLRGLGISKPKR